MKSKSSVNKRIIFLTLLALIILAGFALSARATPTRAAAPLIPAGPANLKASYKGVGNCDPNARNDPNCGCARFIALTEFGNGVSYSSYGSGNGTYDTAKDLAFQKYWNDGYIQFKKVIPWRYRSDVARVGDVLIMKPPADIYILDGNEHTKQPVVSDGHIGYVRSANYVNNKQLNTSTKLSGWEIELESANWGCYASKLYTFGKCTNVSKVKAFIPNGDNFSFWHAVKNPTMVNIGLSDGRKLASTGNLSESKIVLDNGSDNLKQTWVMEKLGTKNYADDEYRIINFATGKCLDVSGASKQEGAEVIEWRCNNGDNQVWTMQSEFDSIVLRSKISTMALTVVPSGSWSNRLQTGIFDYSGGQMFTVNPSKVR